MKIKVDLYECENENCRLIFGVESLNDVECCPKCKSKNHSEVGAGIIKNISEH